MSRFTVFLALFVLLLETAWGIAWWIPSAEERRLADLAERLAPDAPPAEICAEVDLAFRVRLTTEDCRAFKHLCLQGLSSEEALHTVIVYRRALGN